MLRLAAKAASPYSLTTCDCRNPNCSNPSEWRRGTAWVALPRSASSAHPLGQWSAVAQQWSQFCLMGKEIEENQEKQTLFSRIKHDKTSDKTNDSLSLCWNLKSNPSPNISRLALPYHAFYRKVWQRHKRHKLSWKPTTRSESLKFFPVAGFFIPRVVAGIQNHVHETTAAMRKQDNRRQSVHELYI